MSRPMCGQLRQVVTLHQSVCFHASGSALMGQFIKAIKELATYTEVLKTQVYACYVVILVVFSAE